MDTNDNVVLKERSSMKNAMFQDKYYFVPPARIYWTQITILTFMNAMCLATYYLIYTQKLWYSLIFGAFYEHFGGLGVTAGSHRLWAHKSYSAILPLRIFLMIAHTAAGQQSIYKWSRDHRVHHKFSDSDADPHNAKRGFFFAHMGWLVQKKHPELVLKGNKLDYTDLLQDPVVTFQFRNYTILFLIFGIVIPTVIPMIFWGESLTNAIFINIFRYNLSAHSTWFVNSAAHMFGERPYDNAIKPSENMFVTYGSLGEGYHNFHHTFPFDYATSELGGKLNLTKRFIDFMALIGAAYNLKSASKNLISSRRDKTNDSINND